MYLLLLVCGITMVYSRRIPLKPEQAERLSKWTEKDQNIWQLSGQTEGDMILNSEQELFAKNLNRNGIVDIKYRWPNKTLIYAFDQSVLAPQRLIIEQAIAAFPLNSCVKIRSRIASDTYYVNVTTSDNGCYSMLGFLGRIQQLNLQVPGCLRNGTILHEFLHSFGFYHMQSDPTRDSYVQIIWDNIPNGYRDNFLKYTVGITSFGYRYDYRSVMHYDSLAFSSNGLPTIRTINPLNSPIGQRIGMSSTDVAKLNKMYNC